MNEWRSEEDDEFLRYNFLSFHFILKENRTCEENKSYLLNNIWLCKIHMKWNDLNFEFEFNEFKNSWRERERENRGEENEEKE